MATSTGTETTAARPVSPEIQERLQSLKLDRKADKAPRSRKVWWLLVLLLCGGAAYVTRDPERREAWLGLLGSGQLPHEFADCDAFVVSSQPPDDFLLESTGFIAPRAKVHLNPSVPGKIVDLPARVGGRLNKGDVVVRIDDAQYRSDVEQAQAGLDLAQARLRELKAGPRKEDIAQAKAVVKQAEARHALVTGELQRAETVKDIIAPAEYEKYKSAAAEGIAYLEQTKQALAIAEKGATAGQLEVAQAEVDRAQAALEKTKHWLDSTIVRAPISGTVLQRSGETGEFVRPESLVQSLCVIADLSDVEAEVDIQERDLGLVKVGQVCRLTVEAHPDRVFNGRVDRVLPIASRQRGAVQVRVAVQKPDVELLPDMNCRVIFTKPASELPKSDTYRVPKLAVVQEGAAAHLFVLRDSLAQKVTVELGNTNNGETIEVVKGLQDGDRVLLARSGSLRDGQPVNLPKTDVN